jgi:hypothetical protein
MGRHNLKVVEIPSTGLSLDDRNTLEMETFDGAFSL